MEWYCIARGIQRGPMTRDELLALARSGALRPEDYVWTASFGSQWQRLREVAELQAPPPAAAVPAPEAPVLTPVPAPAATPLHGVPGKRPLFAPAMHEAWERMVNLLFRHSSFTRWMGLAFCVWISIVGLYEPNLAGDFLNGVAQPDPAILQKLQGSSSPDQMLACYQDMIGQMVENVRKALTPAVVKTVLAAWLLLTLVTGWFRARGAFMVMHRWHHPDDTAAQSWAAGRRLGWSLFLFRLWFDLLMGLLSAVVGYAFYMQVLAPVLQGTASEAALQGRGILLLLALSAVLTVWLTVAILAEQFVVPVMYWRRVGVLPAWRVVVAFCNERPWPMTIYFTMYLLLVHVALAALLLAMCCTCCCASYLLFLPFVNGILLLPATFFFRGLGICFLRQWRPDLETAEPVGR